RKVYANAEATKHYSHALDLVEKLPAQEQMEKYISLYQKRGMANHALSRFDQAVEDFTSMLDRARQIGSRTSEGAALNALANALFTSHRMIEMQARSDEALRVAIASGSENLQAPALVLIALKHEVYGELVEAKPLFDEAIRVSRAIGDKPALANALTYR